jgi:hypothetical protein
LTVGLKTPSLLVQVLSMHVLGAVHTTPQPPQLLLSLVSSKQPFGQHVSPVGQAGPPLHVVGGVHLPPLQVSPVAHAKAQALQLFGSVCRLVQPAAQHCSPFVQTGPPLQLGGVWHTPP